jgi:hypothetical protein
VIRDGAAITSTDVILLQKRTDDHTLTLVSLAAAVPLTFQSLARGAAITSTDVSMLHQRTDDRTLTLVSLAAAGPLTFQSLARGCGCAEMWLAFNASQ